MTEQAEQEHDVIEVETEAEAPQIESGGQAEADDDDEVVVSIGDAPPPEQEQAERAPEWVRELRKSDREKTRRIKELEAKLSSTTETKPVVELGPKPTLESADYDSDRFEAELTAWHDRKREVEAREADERKQREAADKAWQDRLDSYQKAKTSLRVKDYEEAETAIQDAFSVTQQGIVINGADNPALLIYALGKNPEKAKELAAINDPVKFAFAVAKLESQVKTTNRKAPPPPEKTVSGHASAGAIDNQLERLREEAARTGDYTKVHQYKRQKRAA